MAEQPKVRPRVNGILETFLYVQSAACSATFYRQIFGFEVMDLEDEKLDDDTRLCPICAGDRSVLLLLKKARPPTQMSPGQSTSHSALLGSEFSAWEDWLVSQGIPIEFRRTWKYGAKHCSSAIPTPVRGRYGALFGAHGTVCSKKSLTPPALSERLFSVTTSTVLLDGLESAATRSHTRENQEQSNL